jgi:hypothetical protein
MSKYKRIETQFKDEGTLRQALHDVGIPFEEGEGLTLYGWKGKARPETAEFVIRRRHIESAANDLGFHRLPDGSFEVVISDFDSTSRGMGITRQVKQRYARLQVERLARARGYRVEEIEENGATRLRLHPTAAARPSARVSMRLG